MYIITRENPTNEGLSNPRYSMFWTGEHWSWLEGQAKQYDSQSEAFNIASKIVPQSLMNKVRVELHEFTLEHYKSWQGHDWYKVIRVTSKSEVGCLGFVRSPIFGGGWSIHLYIGNPESHNHEDCGFPSLDEAIKAAEVFLGGKITAIAPKENKCTS